MKRQFLTLAVALLVGTTFCFAQNRKGGGPGDPSERIEQMVTELGLDKDQAKKFKEVMEEMMPGKSNSGERPSREEMEKKREQMDKKMKEILTDEQYKKFNELNQPPQGGRHGKGGRPGNSAND